MKKVLYLSLIAVFSTVCIAAKKTPNISPIVDENSPSFSLAYAEVVKSMQKKYGTGIQTSTKQDVFQDWINHTNNPNEPLKEQAEATIALYISIEKQKQEINKFAASSAPKKVKSNKKQSAQQTQQPTQQQTQQPSQQKTQQQTQQPPQQPALQQPQQSPAVKTK